jgi:phage terminase small subunit
MPGTGNSGGRNKLTAQAHVVKGTFQASRHADHTSPEPPKGRPDSPVALEGLAAEEWERMLTRLEVSSTLAKVDDAAVYQYCRLFAETESHAVSREECSATVKILEENIGDLKDESLVQAFQEITKMRKLELAHASATRAGRMAIRQYLVEFGMTPAARSRVKLPPQKPQSKVDQFRNAKAGA